MASTRIWVFARPRDALLDLVKDASTLHEACSLAFERGRCDYLAMKRRDLESREEFGDGISAGLCGPVSSDELTAKGGA